MTKKQFQALFDRHFDEIRRYLYYRCGDADLATDLTQDTFLKVWEKELTLEPGKDGPLLYKIAGDLFISHYRHKMTGERIAAEIEFTTESRTPEQEMEWNELRDRVGRTLAKLPENQRVVFLMNRREGLTYREIAERLTVSVKAIEKRMTAALAFLRSELKQT